MSGSQATIFFRNLRENYKWDQVQALTCDILQNLFETELITWK